MYKFFVAAASLAALAFPYAFCQAPPADAAAFTLEDAGQGPCRGTALTGVVRDNTSALIPGAKITFDGTQTATSASDGRFRLPCVADGQHSLSVAAEGFATRNLALKTPRPGVVEITLEAGAEINVDVSAEDNPPATANAAGPTATLSGASLQALADDPDDLLRELQQLAAASGGSSANTTISVDGFQGSSTLPPKSSIAYIKINPDQYSAEYRQPPFDGGRVEVYTKPGQKAYHGALFTTIGSPFENARDPFSTSNEAIGKERFGFELSGPIRKTGSDFAMTLEHRNIQNFAVIDATAAGPASNVPAPQQLWVGTARMDWQLGAKNTFIVSYGANVSHLASVGVGGTTLASAGYDSGKYDHTLRISDITTASPKLMHEARLGLRWDGETDVPESTLPQVQVAGAFTGGGATIGQQRLHDFNIEFDDDAIWTPKNHSIKIGTQMMIYNDHNQMTTNFNGTYTFGGSATMTGLQQYQNALAGLPGGTPTAYSSVAGTPTVNFTMFQDALFVQDDWNVGRGVHIAYGVRYFIQNDPTITDGFTPRLGIMWSPTKKGTWTLHAHDGIFTGNFGRSGEAEILREDGVHRITSTIYNPVYGNPTAGATTIYSQREWAPHMSNVLWTAFNFGGTRTLPQGWNLSADYYIGRLWNDTRTENINSPLNGTPNGPRAGAPNTNVLQSQNSGQGNVNAVFGGIENHNYKRVQFFFGGVRVNLVDDTDDTLFSNPQSAFTNAGEFAHRSNQPEWNLFGNSTFNLPGKAQFSTNFNANGEGHYNITTGFDNNGDGNFNDRPQYALPGTPLCTPTTTIAPCAYQTQYGLLVSSGGTGVFPRNKGVMPWTIHLDTNLQRAWKLTKNAKAEHQQTLTLNIRSSNILNHLNVTSVGGVLGSPTFGIPYAADNGRRVEAGARYSF
jgi:hypothetical protein